MDEYTNPYNTLETDVAVDETQTKKRSSSTTFAVSIIRVALVLIIGVFILAQINGNVGQMSSGGITIYLTNNPHDGDTITVDDHVFEFDYGNGVTHGRTPVQIGGSVQETSTNLKNALNQFSYDAK